MAEEEDKKNPEEGEANEAQELERLLAEEEARAGLLPFWKRWQNALQKNKKAAIFGGVGLVLTIGLGVGAYLMFFQPVADQQEAGLPAEEAAPEETKPEVEQALVEVPNVYPLKPFFLPLWENGVETGRFMNVTVHLLLSNRKLDKDIDKIRPLIRQNIYAILKRRHLKDLKLPPDRMQESLKREMLTASNSLLHSGTGTITDIYFTEFIVSPS